MLTKRNIDNSRYGSVQLTSEKSFTDEIFENPTMTSRSSNGVKVIFICGRQNRQKIIYPCCMIVSVTLQEDNELCWEMLEIQRNEHKQLLNNNGIEKSQFKFGSVRKRRNTEVIRKNNGK